MSGLDYLGKPNMVLITKENRKEETINPCIWYGTMTDTPNHECNQCGGYRRECAETEKYFPRGEDIVKSFIEHFKQSWNKRYK